MLFEVGISPVRVLRALQPKPGKAEAEQPREEEVLCFCLFFFFFCFPDAHTILLERNLLLSCPILVSITCVLLILRSLRLSGHHATAQYAQERPPEWSEVGVACVAHLLVVENLPAGRMPWVLSPAFLVRLLVPCSFVLLKEYARLSPSLCWCMHRCAFRCALLLLFVTGRVTVLPLIYAVYGRPSTRICPSSCLPSWYGFCHSLSRVLQQCCQTFRPKRCPPLRTSSAFNR